MRSFLVLCKEKELFDALRSSLGSASTVDHAVSKDGALETVNKRRYDAIFMDMALLRESIPRNNYKAVLQPFWRLYPSVEIIVMSPPEMIREAVMAVKAGAANYLTYPIDPDEVRYVIENIYDTIIMQSELDYLRDQFWRSDCLELVQTTSPVMQNVFATIRSVAPTKSTVLLVGETGTGKGVLARLIHQHSNRKDAQFISVHCGAIPDTLLESELFGHEKGAFTGAVRRKLGKFEIAKGGTIFLDEIGTITPSAQIKLLQVLQDGTFQRVGGEETIQANVRVIAATNMDLRNMCDAGQFRKDLYYRLNVFPVETPPLRERKEDIPYIVQVILARLNRVHLKEIHDIHPDVAEAFRNYSWPGNIRELENLLERAWIIENSSVLTPEAFPGELFPSPLSSPSGAVDSSLCLAEVRRKALEDIERRYLKELLATKRGRIRESAEAAGITTRQLHKLLSRYGIRKEEFKARTKKPEL
ncbi:MAG: sigma-54 interaction domain-containing protein [Syntrophobacteria bacterium]